MLDLDEGAAAVAEAREVRALSIRERSLGEAHPDVGRSVFVLAEIYTAEGRASEAEPLYLRATRILEAALGPEHADTARMRERAR